MRKLLATAFRPWSKATCSKATFQERTGQVCDTTCRARARRDSARTFALTAR